MILKFLKMSGLSEKKKRTLLAVGLAVVASTLMTTAISSPMFAFAQTATTMPNAGAAANVRAVAGTISVVQAAKDFLDSSLNATMIDAATAAEAQVANGATIEGKLGIMQGSLVYNITVADGTSGTAYNVFVDPATGKVLSKSTGLQLDALGLPAGFDNATKTLIDAADVAENQVQNGMAVAGAIEAPTQGQNGSSGTLVYEIVVADIDNGTLHKMEVDSTTGSIISSPEVVPLGELHIGNLF